MNNYDICPNNNVFMQKNINIIAPYPCRQRDYAKNIQNSPFVLNKYSNEMYSLDE